MTKRALISVSDKAGIVEFAQELNDGWSCQDPSPKYTRWTPRSS